MEPAYALSDAPKPISATSLDPYGQLLRMLLPRAQSIVVCDRAGVSVWESDGQGGSNLQTLMQEMQADLAGTSSASNGFAEPLSPEQTAYVFLLRDDSCALVGSVGLVCRDAGGESRPFDRRCHHCR